MWVIFLYSIYQFFSFFFIFILEIFLISNLQEEKTNNVDDIEESLKYAWNKSIFSAD